MVMFVFPFPAIGNIRYIALVPLTAPVLFLPLLNERPGWGHRYINQGRYSLSAHGASGRYPYYKSEPKYLQAKLLEVNFFEPGIGRQHL